MAAKKAPQYRKKTTDPHPLFDGNAAQYNGDKAWRQDIPKAGVLVDIAQARAALAKLHWGARR
jgi:hypothetical protein